VLLFGLNVSLIGMGIVFSALVLLVFVIRAISKAAVFLDKRTCAVTAKAGVSLPSAAMAGQGEKGIEEEIAAVIGATVAAFRVGRE